MSLRGDSLAPRKDVPKASVVLRDHWWWAPLAMLFKVALKARHFAFDVGLLRARKGSLPSVVMGNITVGGTGKTPHVKALMEALAQRESPVRWAILSRGYGRSTTGFLRVEKDGTAADYGDEPLELCRKFPKSTVAVCEDRVAGISRLQTSGLADAVILDDGFQHRRLTPTYSILLVDSTQPIDRDHFLPRGRLRDLPERASTADAVIITRCPDAMTKGDLRLWRHRLHMKPEQWLLHTGTAVEGLRDLRTKRYSAWPRKAMAVSGIAHPGQFEADLNRNCRVTKHFSYPDHHVYTAKELAEWNAHFQNELSGAEAIITTEKDASRLRHLDLPEGVPFLVMGQAIKWWDDDALQSLLTSILSRVDASRSETDI